MNSKKWLLAITGFVALAGCVYTKKEVVQASCNLPDSVSYAGKVVPILQSNCYICHSTASNISGILLDNYNALKTYAQAGILYRVINHEPGVSPMPDGGAKLDDCTIATIKKWIDQGSQRN
jgi:hypothetical protein